jgi:hypothetical protein
VGRLPTRKRSDGSDVTIQGRRAVQTINAKRFAVLNRFDRSSFALLCQILRSGHERIFNQNL